MMKWFVRLGVALSLLLASVSVISAHASLVKANPAPNAVLGQAPGQVQLWFDEEVEPAFSQVQVIDSARTRVDSGSLALAPGDSKSLVTPLKPLGNGTFAVVWKVLSATDGHITRGVYAFSVGQATGSSTSTLEANSGLDEFSPIPAGIRWLSLLSLLALAGGLFFWLALLTPSLRTIEFDWTTATGGNIQRRWIRLAGLALILALVANTAELLLETSLVTDQLSIPSLTNILFATRFGSLWLIRMAFLLVIGALLLARARGLLKRPTWLVVLALLSELVLLTRSLGSHGAAVEGDLSLAVLADWAHLIGVSVWVGGLVYFALLLPFIWRVLEPTLRNRWLARLITRFSIVAIFATLVIALTGLYNSALELPSLDALIQTVYGDTLTIKIAFFGVMLLFGAINLFWIGPRFRRVASPPAGAQLFSRFRITLAIEVVLGLGAILLAALLTLQPPARAQLNPGAPTAVPNTRVVLSGDAAPDARVTLVIGPDAGTPTQFDARVVDAQGQPTTNILRVIFNFTLLDSDAGTQNFNADPGAEGHYTVSGNYITLDGMWRIRVIVRRKGIEDTSVEFPFYRAPRGSATPTDTPPARTLLVQAEAWMNNLTSLRSTQYLNDGANGVLITDSEFQAPDRLRFTLRGEGTSIAIGREQYFEQSGAWTASARAVPYVFPKFDLSKQAMWVAPGRSENATDGEPAQIVRFAIPNSSGTAGIQYAYWLSTQDGRLLQYAMVTDAHYMFEYYHDPNAPDIQIIAPAVTAVTPLPAATPNPAVVAAPLTGARRPQGFITGDLEGDGALILLIAGIAAGALGLGRRLARPLQLTAIGVAVVCIVAGVGLFADAVNAITLANQNVSVNPQLASAGSTTYQEYCVSCHGPLGKGDGPAGAALPVKPVDLTTHVLLHDEFYLHDVILNGRGNMPAFGSYLSQDEIVNLIAYIRQLALDA
ncbi:MAG: copper resistance protein CopC, partial [Anaerolineae bacterium]